MKEKIKESYINILRQVKRKGMKSLEKHLVDSGFFEQPASSKYHNVFKGGLALHSLSVYTMFNSLIEDANISIPKESIIISSLLHDICKVGTYGMKGEKFYKSKDKFGHGGKSVEIINKHISLSDLEEKLIRFHMGLYGTTDFSTRYGEYSLSRLVMEYRNNPELELFHYADNMVAKFIDKR